MKRILGMVICVVLVVVLGGCSWFGKKKGEGDASDLSESDLNAQREGRFGSGSIPSAEGEGMFRDIQFDYDSAAISDAARQDIEYNQQILTTNSDVKIQLEGHTDERGTADYNMALGQARSKAVQDVLGSYGIPASRLSTISYGEEVPLDPNHDEGAWSKNRRVHFSAYRDMANR